VQVSFEMRDKNQTVVEGTTDTTAQITNRRKGEEERCRGTLGIIHLMLNAMESGRGLDRAAIGAP